LSPSKKTISKNTPEKIINRINIRVSGSGGQGIISTGMLLGEAIAIGDGKNVTQSQSYGPEARGGSTRADIIVSDGEIYFPECNDLDILLVFTYEAYGKFATKTKPDGTVIADESAVDVIVGNAKTVQVPFIQLAEKQFKTPLVANIMAMGFLSTYTKVVTQNSLREVVEEQYSSTPHLEMNINALEEGFKLGSKFCKNET
jgi:2-oxoglutarate ferredoxin oxidoreductase subunit gamma